MRISGVSGEIDNRTERSLAGGIVEVWKGRKAVAERGMEEWKWRRGLSFRLVDKLLRKSWMGIRLASGVENACSNFLKRERERGRLFLVVESWKESLEREGEGKGREKGEMRNWKERKGREREKERGKKWRRMEWASYYNILNQASLTKFSFYRFLLI